MDDEKLRTTLFELIEKQEQEELYNFLEEHELSLEEYLSDDGSHPVHFAAQHSTLQFISLSSLTLFVSPWKFHFKQTFNACFHCFIPFNLVPMTATKRHRQLIFPFSPQNSPLQLMPW